MKPAFTFIELLVVITIIVVLLALLTPAIDKAMDSAQQAVCATQLHQIGLGFHLYSQDHHRHVPYSFFYGGYRWFHKLRPYLNSARLYDCPGAPHLTDQFTERTEANWAGEPMPMEYGYNYFYLGGEMDGDTGNVIGRHPIRMNKIQDQTGTILAADVDMASRTGTPFPSLVNHWSLPIGRLHRDGTNIVFPDMHVEWRTYDFIAWTEPPWFTPEHD